MSLPFINHLKITLKAQSSTQTDKNQTILLYKVCYSTRSRFLPGKRNAGMYYWILKVNVPETFLLVIYTFHIKFYFSGKRQRKSSKHLGKTCHWKLILLFEVIARNLSTWALKHPRHLSTYVRKASEHVSTQGTLAREHICTQGTLAHEYICTQATLAHEHVRHPI